MSNGPYKSSIRTGVILAIISAIGCGAIHWKYGKPPPKVVVPETPPASTLEHGNRIYNQVCSTCHGPEGYGLPKQGANLAESKYVRETDDIALVDMIEKGRIPADPKSLMKILMPPKGNNQALTTQDLFDVVEYIRELQKKALEEAEKQ